MFIALRVMAIAAISLIGGILLTPANARGTSKLTLVEVWSAADDGLTSKLRDMVELEVKNSPDFKLSTGSRFNTIILTIASSIVVADTLSGKRANYIIELTDRNQKHIGRQPGTCPAARLSRCAKEALLYMRQVAKNATL